MRALILSTLISLALLAGPSVPTATAAPLATMPSAGLLAQVETDWDWDGAKRFWRRQFGRTSGVVGLVSLIVVVGVLIVMSSRKKI